jgi:hypothetical protein
MACWLPAYTVRDVVVCDREHAYVQRFLQSGEGKVTGFLWMSTQQQVPRFPGSPHAADNLGAPQVVQELSERRGLVRKLAVLPPAVRSKGTALGANRRAIPGALSAVDERDCPATHSC